MPTALVCAEEFRQKTSPKSPCEQKNVQNGKILRQLSLIFIVARMRMNETNFNHLCLDSICRRNDSFRDQCSGWELAGRELARPFKSQSQFWIAVPQQQCVVSQSESERIVSSEGKEQCCEKRFLKKWSCENSIENSSTLCSKSNLASVDFFG